MTLRMVAATLVLGATVTATAPAQWLAEALRPPTVGVMVVTERAPHPRLLEQVRREVEDVFRPTGLDLRWELLGDGKRPGTYDRAVVVELKGECNPDRMKEIQSNSGKGRLGWTLISDGEVIPHTAVDCEEIARAAAGARLLTSNPQLLAQTYRRLVARVLTHELLHALLRSADHNDTGCLKTPLRLADLQAPAKLRPNEVASLREIGRASGPKLASHPPAGSPDPAR